MNDPIAAERAAARYIAGLALGVLAVALAWFAYIDAPITDQVMIWVACAVAAGLTAALAALWGYASTLRAPVDQAAAVVPRRVVRLRRLAMLALSALLLIMALAMVATLNVRGADSGADGEGTSGTV